MGADIMTDLTDDEVLRFTQQARKGLVDDIIAGGMPKDPKDRSTLLQALSDMDRTALTKKRIVGDAKNAEADRVAAKAIAHIFERMGTRSPFEGNEVPGRVIDMPETLLDDVRAVPGETDIGIANLTYDSFQASRD